MAEYFVTEFTHPDRDAAPRDMLSRLYREIGISAVAAALDVMSAPDPHAAAETYEEHQLPALLRNQDLAA